MNPLSWTKESDLGSFTMTKFSFEDKLRAVNMYLKGYGSNTVAKVYKVKNHSNILLYGFTSIHLFFILSILLIVVYFLIKIYLDKKLKLAEKNIYP